MAEIVVFGASDQAKCTIDILERTGDHRIVGLIDDNAAVGTPVYGYPVLGTTGELPGLAAHHGFTGGLVAIGDNHVRARVVDRIVAALPGFEFVTAIHPFTSIGRDTRIGAGAVIMAGAVVNGSSVVGRHALINARASLDHDSVLGEFASLGPNSATGGRVRIGTGTAVAIGATVLHGRTIGAHTVVGAGATVIADLPDHVVAYGTPCRVVRERSTDEKYL